VPLLVGTAAAACFIAAAATFGAGLVSGVSLSATSAPAKSNWQHVVMSRQLVVGGRSAASQTLHGAPGPYGPPGHKSPRATIELVQASTTQHGIASATASLGQALDPSLWIDDFHVTLSFDHGRPQGRQVFRETRTAVHQLKGIKPSSPAWAVTDMTWLDYAIRLLGKTEINDNSHCPKRPWKLAAAKRNIAAGDRAYRHGRYAIAIGRYKNAWLHAVEANGRSCHGTGITVTPTGSPAFSLLHMVPGDSSATGTITVKITETSSPLVVLYEHHVVDGGLLAGAYPLQLKIVEDGSHTLYSGPLKSGWTGSGTHYLTLPGSSGKKWAKNESHTFVFTVSWSPLAGNPYQSKTASLNFVWARS